MLQYTSMILNENEAFKAEEDKEHAIKQGENAEF